MCDLELTYPRTRTQEQSMSLLLAHNLVEWAYETRDRQNYPHVFGYGDNCEIAFYKVTDYVAAQESARAGDKKAVKKCVEAAPVLDKVRPARVPEPVYQAVLEIRFAIELARIVLKKDFQGFEDLSVKTGFAEKGSSKMATLWSSATSKIERIKEEKAKMAASNSPGFRNAYAAVTVQEYAKRCIEDVANDILYQAGRKAVIFCRPGMEKKWRKRQINLNQEGNLD